MSNDGFTDNGINLLTGTKYDEFGFDSHGYTPNGNNIFYYFVSKFIGKDSFFGYLGDVYKFGSLFGLEKFPKGNVFDIDGYKFKESEQYRTIFLDMPLCPNKIHNKEKIDIISNFINHLSDDGYLFICIEPRFIEELQNKGYKISGVIECKRGDIPGSGIIPFIAIISKNNNDEKLFLASLENTNNISLIYENFINKKDSANLSEGVFIQNNYNIGIFNYYRSKLEIDNLDSDYKEFDKYEFSKLGDISFVKESDMNDNDFNEGEYLFIISIGNIRVVGTRSNITGNYRNWFKVKVKENIVSKEYLLNYFKTDLAISSLKGCCSGAYIPKISLSNLMKLEVPVLEFEKQKKLNIAYKKLEDMQQYIKDVKKKLSVSPNSIDEILGDLTEEKLRCISEADKIHDIIKGGESLHTEFKQTFFADIKNHSEQDYIKKEALKNIAGFLNQEGGDLLIGIDDSGQICGIEKDIYQNDDKYLQKVSNILENSFGIGKKIYDLVKYNIVSIDGAKVLHLKCLRSTDIIFLKGEEDGAYVRQSPKTLKYTGAELIQFSEQHKRRNEEIARLAKVIQDKSNGDDF